MIEVEIIVRDKFKIEVLIMFQEFFLVFFERDRKRGKGRDRDSIYFFVVGEIFEIINEILKEGQVEFVDLSFLCIGDFRNFVLKGRDVKMVDGK